MPRPPSVEHGDVDAPIFIAVIKADRIGLVEQIGVENHCPVGAIGHPDRLRPFFLQERVGDLGRRRPGAQRRERVGAHLLGVGAVHDLLGAALAQTVRLEVDDHRRPVGQPPEHVEAAVVRDRFENLGLVDGLARSDEREPFDLLIGDEQIAFDALGERLRRRGRELELRILSPQQTGSGVRRQSGIEPVR